jgi:hypothetical protein
MSLSIISKVGLIKQNISWVWWHIHVMPALRRLRKENSEFETNLVTQGDRSQHSNNNKNNNPGQLLFIYI